MTGKYSTSISPRNLFIFPLPRFHGQALLVHFVHITCRLHVAQNVILEVADGFERVRDDLVLLDITDDLGCFGPLGKVNVVGLLDNRWDTILDEGQVGEIDTLRTRSAMYVGVISRVTYQRRECTEGLHNAVFPDIPQSS